MTSSLSLLSSVLMKVSRLLSSFGVMGGEEFLLLTSFSLFGLRTVVRTSGAVSYLLEAFVITPFGVTSLSDSIGQYWVLRVSYAESGESAGESTLWMLRLAFVDEHSPLRLVFRTLRGSITLRAPQAGRHCSGLEVFNLHREGFR